MVVGGGGGVGFVRSVIVTDVLAAMCCGVYLFLMPLGLFCVLKDVIIPKLQQGTRAIGMIPGSKIVKQRLGPPTLLYWFLSGLRGCH